MPHLADAGGPFRTADRGGHLGEWPDLVRHEVDDRALALELPLDQQQGVAPDDATEARPGVGPERDVDHPGLILEREEDRALGGHRVLARHHEAAHPGPDRASVGQLSVRDRAELHERLAEQPDDLVSGVEADHRIRIADPLDLADRGQLRRLRRRQAQVQRPARCRRLLPAGPPQCPERLAVDAAP